MIRTRRKVFARVVGWSSVPIFFVWLAVAGSLVMPRWLAATLVSIVVVIVMVFSDDTEEAE